MYNLLSLTITLALTSTVLTACTITPTQKPTIKQPPKPQLALVLGGGGAKGFAHVGVIKVLEKNGIKPDLIVGTSSGAIVGSLYASGKSADQLEDIATHVSNNDLLDYTLSKQGFIEGIKLQNWVNRQVGNRNIEQLPIRFAAVATNLSTTDPTAQKVVFTQGETGLAVRASSSVPNVFISPRINNQRYADGGLVSLVPVQTAKDLGANVVIAVDVSAPAKPKNQNQLDFWVVLDKNLGVMPTNKSDEIQLADVVIRPDVGHIGTADLINREATIQAGEVATQQNLAAIKKALSANP